MPAPARAAVPPPPRKPLLEWIETDDGDAPDNDIPACSPAIRTLHARLVDRPASRDDAPFEPIAPPPSLALAPLG